MQFLFEVYNRFGYILRILIPFVTFVIGFIISKLKHYKSNGKIENVLSLKKDDSVIIMPIWDGRGIVREVNPARKCIIYEESFILPEILTTISDIFKNKFSAKFEGLVDGTTLLEPSKNHFYFWGYIPHYNVYRMLQKYCSNVKFSCEEKYFENNERKNVLYPCLHEDNLRHIKIGSFVFTYDCVEEGYIILIKLTNKVLQNDERGTVHICFGNSATLTLSSAQCFNKYRVELHKKLKKRKTCYFAIMKCYKNGEIDFTSFIDFTDQVFGNYVG